MITAFLLLPLTGVLVWIYGYLLPRRWAWSRFDLGLLGATLLLAAAWTGWMNSHDFDGAGPTFGHLGAAAGAYPIILSSLAAGLAWRWRRASGGGSR